MIVRDDFLAGEEAKGSKWACYVSSSGSLYTSNTGHTGHGYANIVLANNEALVCRKHRDGASGSYWCEHLKQAIAHPAFFENMTQTLEPQFSFQLRVVDSVFVEVLVDRVNDTTVMIRVAGHNETSIGLVMPQYEGLPVIREMVLNHYDEWTVASPTMCTSTQHWRANNSAFGLKDKICLDSEKMCYPCAARTAQAMRQVDAPESQDNGFSTLPPSTPKKIPPGTAVYTTPEGELSPFAGGNPTTVGSTRSSDGAVWDGTCWVNHGERTTSEVEVPFNLTTADQAFASSLDQKTWHEFYVTLEAKDKS